MDVVRLRTLLWLMLACWPASSATAASCVMEGDRVTLTFEGLDNGTIVDTDFVCSHGVVISATTDSPEWPDLAIVFDATEGANPNDFDLQGPLWDYGNLPDDEVLGNLLIVSSDEDLNGDDKVFQVDFESPDPFEAADDFEGSPTLGYSTITLKFAGGGGKDLEFDFVDVQPEFAHLYTVTFLSGGVELDSINFLEFTMMGSPYFDPFDPVEFGNNSANHVEIPPGLIGIFDEVQFRMAGGGLDNITYTFVPEPSSWALFGMGAAALAYVRRRRGQRRQKSLEHAPPC